jgi:hypothetical protein
MRLRELAEARVRFGYRTGGVEAIIYTQPKLCYIPHMQSHW